MATLNSSLSHLTESQFNLAPVPDMITGDFISGEESFVVLGHSLEDVNSLAPKVTVAAPVIQNSIIDRIEENVDTILAELSNTSAECPLPAVENHFQPKNKQETIATISSDLSPEEIDKKLTSILAENEQLKHTILQNNLSMKSQYHKIMDWHDDVEKTYKVHKEKLEQAKQYIASLKTEIADLKSQIKSQGQGTLSTQNSEMENSAKDLEKLTITEKNDDKIAELNKLLVISQAEVEKLRSEVLRLNSLLQVAAINTSSGHKYEMGAAERRRSEDIACYQEEIKTFRQQLMSAQQKITQLDCVTQSLNGCIKTKEDEILKLTDLLQSFKYTEDDMFALKTQLDVYKGDFETEQRAKETILDEKNQLAEEANNLQARNRELQEEVELLRNHTDYSILPVMHPPSVSSASFRMSAKKYECPKCQFVFKTYEALENHVHRCLDLEGTLP